jgi:hypothetical protein
VHYILIFNTFHKIGKEYNLLHKTNKDCDMAGPSCNFCPHNSSILNQGLKYEQSNKKINTRNVTFLKRITGDVKKMRFMGQKGSCNDCPDDRGSKHL